MHPLFVHVTHLAIPATFYSHGSAAGDETVTQGDDGCPLVLDFPTVVFGIPHDEVHVCTNTTITGLHNQNKNGQHYWMIVI